MKRMLTLEKLFSKIPLIMKPMNMTFKWNKSDRLAIYQLKIQCTHSGTHLGLAKNGSKATKNKALQKWKGFESFKFSIQFFHTTFFAALKSFTVNLVSSITHNMTFMSTTYFFYVCAMCVCVSNSTISYNVCTHTLCLVFSVHIIKRGRVSEKK